MKIQTITKIGLLTMLFGAVAPSAFGTVATYSGSSGNLSAEADFSFSGSTLTITLINTSTSDVLVPSDVLTGVFFNTIAALTPVSASLNGSTVYYGSIGTLGNGWGYANGVSAQGKNSAISASGAVTGLGHSNFGNSSTALQGLDYGILSAGDNSATGNTGVTGHGPLIKDEVVFTLTTYNGFSLSDLGSSVVFQYGTALTEPNITGNIIPDGTQFSSVPEPSTIVAGALLLLPLGVSAIRILRKNKIQAIS